MNERELLNKKAALVAQARGMLDQCDAEKRDFTTEEQTNYDAIFAEVSKIDVKIDNLRKLGSVEVPSELLGQAIKPEATGSKNPDEEKRNKAWS